MTIPPGIGAADAVILYSGPQSAFDTHESALRSLGAGSTYLGVDHGLSSLYDVALLSVMWSILNGFPQGAALLETAKGDAATFAPLASVGITAHGEAAYPVLAIARPDGDAVTLRFAAYQGVSTARVDTPLTAVAAAG